MPKKNSSARIFRLPRIFYARRILRPALPANFGNFGNEIRRCDKNRRQKSGDCGGVMREMFADKTRDAIITVIITRPPPQNEFLILLRARFFQRIGAQLSAG